MSNDIVPPIKLDELIARSPDAVVAHDMESRVLYWNQAAEKLYGWVLDEIRGRPVARIFYLDSGARADALQTLLSFDRSCSVPSSFP